MTAVNEALRRDRKDANSARRQQVIDGAAATFARLGYHGASTRAIADTLGIKVASLYFHIASKEEALEEVCARGMEQSRTYLRRALNECDTLAARIRRFFEHQRDDFVAHADYVTVSIREGRHLSDVAQKRIAILSRQLRDDIDNMFEMASEKGELHPSLTPRQARFVFIATVRSMSELYANGNIRDFGQLHSAWSEAVIRGTGSSDENESLQQNAG